ncbi:MAG: hypothetical protein AAFP81_17060 [Pseudomonadota bacterium]
MTKEMHRLRLKKGNCVDNQTIGIDREGSKFLEADISSTIFERREMMDRWSNYVTGQENADVIPFNREAIKQTV